MFAGGPVSLPLPPWLCPVGFIWDHSHKTTNHFDVEGGRLAFVCDYWDKLKPILFNSESAPGTGQVCADLCSTDFASCDNGIFCRLGREFCLDNSITGMLGTGLGVYRSLASKDGSSDRSAKGEKANDGASKDQPIGPSSPIGRLFSGVRSFPLGAKVGIAIVLPGLAGWVGVFGFIGLLDCRLTYRRRVGRGLLVLFGLGLFCTPTVLWW
ncbi:hypothetical protein [Mesorhizobium sp. WSM4904]|uniref:hypothetical protein n=1 Tax=Mesorhizobium sp. WSM4904 TaxID=3038545 RepID=UPI00241884C4|nr:hypothetical protein [Mesorhizobium sp. WSM4904]WFP61607.1 hypothetical protein QAZ47_24480 [Mesorhizobium sp. WSM4904]